MTIITQANTSQLDEVEVTIDITMKLRDWKLVEQSIRKDAKDDYHWTRAEFANQLQEVISEYTDKVSKTFQPK